MPRVEIDRAKCRFPQPSERRDTRTFSDGEKVCWRQPRVVLASSPTYEGTYLGRFNDIQYKIDTGSGNADGYDRIHWGHVGKILPVNPSDEREIEQAPLEVPENPPELEQREYNTPGGRRKRTRKPKRKSRKTRRGGR